MNMRKTFYATLCATFCGMTASYADVSAAIQVREGSQTVNQNVSIRWQSTSKQYVVTRKDSAVTYNLKPEAILQKRVVAPADWAKVRAAPAANIARLEAIVSEYLMLDYDELAAGLLARVYLADKKPQNAIKVCEKIIAENPAAAYASAMSPFYWQALMITGKTAGLDKMFDNAALYASNGTAARALIFRGDLYTKESRLKDALKDGYLRVVFLYRSEPAARAEALFKAAETFDKLNQTSYAERMRQQLLTQHADSEHAKRLRGN